jgi:hypothetical protein
MKKMFLKKKPIIFLAFANDKVNDTTYLRNLPNEMRGIRAVLDKAVQANLCKVIERANANIEDIVDVFQNNNHQIAIGNQPPAQSKA